MRAKQILSAMTAVAVFAVVVLGVNPAGASRRASDTAPAAGVETITEASKDEVVYARLSPTGAVDNVYVVNHFETAAGEVVDYGNYDSVQNLTDTSEVTQNGDAVTFTSSGGNFYYQGNMDTAELPWNFDITYDLDGQQMAPEDMGGKSGRMEIKIVSSQNMAVDPTFYDNYMLQITVTLDTSKCSNIDAPKATVAEAGKNKLLTYAVMPETNAADILAADVQDFTMTTGVQVSGVPYSMEVEIPETDDQFEDLEKLPEAISELNDGVGELADGTDSMKSGADKLVSGSASIQEGLSLLSGSSAELVGGSAKINSALATISASLNDGSLDDLDFSQMQQLPDTLKEMAKGLEKTSAGLAALKSGFEQGYTALDGAIQGIPAPTGKVNDTVMANLYGATGGDADMMAALDELAATYTAAQTVKGTYAAVKPAFDAVGPAIDEMLPGIDTMAAGLNTMATEIGKAMKKLKGLDKLKDLAKGMKELSANYETFHSGLVSYTGGVDTLSANYGTFQSGLSKFAGGVGELDDGVVELHDGTKTLNKEVSTLPDTLQEEIDKMKDQYLPADFDAVSFTSAKNTDTAYVQFVMQCDGIEEPEAPEETPEEEAPETFWDRFVALFTGGLKD